MHIVCSDLEGVFVPEIWINVAEKTGIDELRLTTRDISDYDVLMKKTKPSSWLRQLKKKLARRNFLIKILQFFTELMHKAGRWRIYSIKKKFLM